MVFGLSMSGLIPGTNVQVQAATEDDKLNSISKVILVPGSGGLSDNNNNPGVPYVGKAGTDIELSILKLMDSNNKEVTMTEAGIIDSKWTVSGTGATIYNENMLKTITAGVVTLTLTLTGGVSGKIRKQVTTKIKMEHVPVDSITVFNTVMDQTATNTIQIDAGKTYDLSTEVEVTSTSGYKPTIQTIVWSAVAEAGDYIEVNTVKKYETDAKIMRNSLTTIYRGQFTLVATIKGGGVNGADVIQKVKVKVNYKPVTSVERLPKTVVVGEDTGLVGLVTPTDATYQDIAWSIVRTGTTGAEITNTGLLKTKSTGDLTVRATIKKGKDELVAFVDDFDIEVVEKYIPVVAINNVPTKIRRGTDRPIDGVVEPFTATSNNIIWTVKSAGSTGATIRDNNLLTTIRTGKITVTASIYRDASNTSVVYTKDFNIDIVDYFIPVSNINLLSKEAIVNNYLTLTSIVSPVNADNKKITWSVINDGGTGAVVTADKFIAYKEGTATVRATIEYGKTETENYYQDFDIFVDKVFTAVSSIGKVVDEVKMMQSVTLGGTVSPSTATNKEIQWSMVNAGGTGATVDEKGKFTATKAGTAIVRATIKNGRAKNVNYIQDFSIKVTPVYVAVKSIADSIPKNMLVNETITLQGTVEPDNATNRGITWSVLDKGATGATLTSGNKLKVTAAGTVKVRATVINGKTATTNFTKDYSIVVKDLPHIAVKKINNLPTQSWVNKSIRLSGTVDPVGATAKSIKWSIKDKGGTNATITGGSTLKATKAGTVKIVATIENGLAKGKPYTQEFSVNIAHYGGAGSNISGNKIGLYAKLGSGGVATAKVTETAVTAALSANPKNPTVVVNLSASRTAVGFSVNVEQGAIDALISRNVRSFIIQGKMGSVTLSAAGLQQIRGSAKGNVSFKLTKINASKLPRAAKRKAEGKSTYALSVNYYEGSTLKQVQKLTLGSILFSVPAKTTRTLKNPVLASLTNRGRVIKYKSSTYDDKTKQVSFRTKKMGNFIVTNR